MPSDLLLHSVEFGDLGVESLLDGGGGIIDALLDGGGSVGDNLSPGVVLGGNGGLPVGPSGVTEGAVLVPSLSLNTVEAFLGSSDSSFVLLDNEFLSGGHLGHDSGDLLVLLLLVAVAPSPVAISVWVIAILWAFGTEAEWLRVVWVEWHGSSCAVALDLGEEACVVGVDWASGESVFVVSSTSLSSGECLSDDPGHVLPEVVLGGDESDLVNIS